MPQVFMSFPAELSVLAGCFDGVLDLSAAAPPHSETAREKVRAAFRRWFELAGELLILVDDARHVPDAGTRRTIRLALCKVHNALSPLTTLDPTGNEGVAYLARPSTRARMTEARQAISEAVDLCHCLKVTTEIPLAEPIAPATLDVSEEPIPQYVTLDGMSAIVSRSKRTLEKYKGNGLPPPDVEGGGGKPDEWEWSKVRPWLETAFCRKLPIRFPSRHPAI